MGKLTLRRVCNGPSAGTPRCCGTQRARLPRQHTSTAFKQRQDTTQHGRAPRTCKAERAAHKQTLRLEVHGQQLQRRHAAAPALAAALQAPFRHADRRAGDGERSADDGRRRSSSPAVRTRRRGPAQHSQLATQAGGMHACACAAQHRPNRPRPPLHPAPCPTHPPTHPTPHLDGLQEGREVFEGGVARAPQAQAHHVGQVARLCGVGRPAEQGASLSWAGKKS